MRGSWRSLAAAGGKAVGMMMSERLSEFVKPVHVGQQRQHLSQPGSCMAVSCATCTPAVSLHSHPAAQLLHGWT